MPIALYQRSLTRPLSELNLLVNLSGIHSQQRHLFMIVLPSDHLPFVNSSPMGIPTASWSPPIVQPGKTESEERQDRSEGRREALPCCGIQFRDVSGEAPSLHIEPGERAGGQPRAILCPRQPDGFSDNIDAFCLETFVETSHFPTNHTKCWASPKPLCLLHSP
jgi:hypothetical protein